MTLSAAGCSSSGSSSSTAASSAGPNVSAATGTATPTPKAPTPGATSNPTTPTGTATAPTGNNTKAICTRVLTILTDSSRSALAALGSLKSGDLNKLAEAQAKADVYYRHGADQLRAEAANAQTATLRTAILSAARYIETAAKATPSTGSDSILPLTRACAGSR